MRFIEKYHRHLLDRLSRLLLLGVFAIVGLLRQASAKYPFAFGFKRWRILLDASRIPTNQKIVGGPSSFLLVVNRWLEFPIFQ